MTIPDDGFNAARFLDLVRLARPTAHEIRGACGTMAIHLELARATLDSVAEVTLREQLSRYLEVLQRERQRLLSAAQAFLALVALPDAPAETFDLGALVHETGEALRPLATERRMHLDVLRPSLPVPLTAVQEDVRQRLLDVTFPILDEAPAGAHLSLQLTAGDDSATITVGGADGPPAVLTMPRRGRG